MKLKELLNVLSPHVHLKIRDSMRHNDLIYEGENMKMYEMLKNKEVISVSPITTYGYRIYDNKYLMLELGYEVYVE